MTIDRRSIAVAAAGFCSFLDLYTTQGLLPELRSEFHIGEAAAAATVSATTLAVALVAPLAGYLADRLGRKIAIVAGAVLMAVPTALAASSTDVYQLIFWRFAQGLLLPAVFSVTTAHIAEEWPQKDAARMVGLHMSGMVIGGFSGRYIAALVSSALGWQAAFPVLAALNLVGAAVIALWMPRDHPTTPPLEAHHPVDAVRTLIGHLGNPRLLATCAIGFCVLFGMVAVFTYMNFRLADPPFSFGLAALSNIFTIFLLGVPAAALGPRMLNLARRSYVVAGAILMCILGLSLSLSENLALILTGLCLFSFGQLAVQPLALGYIGQVTKGGKSMAVGLYVSFYYIGGSAGGVVPALGWSRFGWSGCIILVMAVEVAIAVLALFYWRPAKQENGAE